MGYPMRKKTLRHRPTSLRAAMEACVEHARGRHNRSVDHVADLMGIPSKWALYKWMESGRMPALLIRPFERACGADYISRYIAASAGKLLVDVPTGRNITEQDVSALQASFAAATSALLNFYEGETSTGEALDALQDTLERLAWHRGLLERHDHPELELGGDS